MVRVVGVGVAVAVWCALACLAAGAASTDAPSLRDDEARTLLAALARAQTALAQTEAQIALLEPVCEASVHEGRVRERPKQDDEANPCAGVGGLQVLEGIACGYGRAVAIFSMFSTMSWSSALLTQVPDVIAIALMFPDTHVPLLSEIGLLTNVQFFIAQEGLEGPIPTELGLLEDLVLLSFIEQPNGGPLPSQLGRLTKLEALKLDAIGLSSTFPSQLCRLTLLQSLDLFGNDVHGTLPSQLALLTNLVAIELSSTALSGTVPRGLFASSHLESVDASSSRLSGSLPTQLAHLTFLTSISFHSGLLGGSLPTQLGLLTALNALVLSDNQIVGTIPTQLGLLRALTFLALQDNLLHGTLPLQVQRLPEIGSIQVYNNDLEGGVNETFVAALGTNFACTRSGLEPEQCHKPCTSCGSFSLGMGTCNAQGKGKSCLPGYYLAAAMAGLVAAVALLLRFALPSKVARGGRLVRSALVVSLGLLDMGTDISFAVTRIGSPTGVASACLLAASLLANAWLGIRMYRALEVAATAIRNGSVRVSMRRSVRGIELVPINEDADADDDPGRESGGEGKPSERRESSATEGKVLYLRKEHLSGLEDLHARAREHPVAVSLAALLSLLNPHLLVLLVGREVAESTFRVHVGVVASGLSVLLEDLPQMVIQSISFATSSQTLLVAASLALSGVSVLFQVTNALLTYFISSFFDSEPPNAR